MAGVSLTDGPSPSQWKIMRQIPATSVESDAFSKDPKRRGFSFVGSTVVPAHMQAVGIVNDHLVECFRLSGDPAGLDKPCFPVTKSLEMALKTDKFVIF